MVFDAKNRVRSKSAQQLLGRLDYKIAKKSHIGKCGKNILQSLTSKNESDFFTIITQSIPLGAQFFTTEYFLIFDVENDE